METKVKLEIYHTISICIRRINLITTLRLLELIMEMNLNVMSYIIIMVFYIENLCGDPNKMQWLKESINIL